MRKENTMKKKTTTNETPDLKKLYEDGTLTRADLTENSMLKFIKENGTAEDKAWFKQLCKANKVMKETKKDGKRETIVLKVVRDEMMKRFFTKEKIGFFDELENL